MAVLTAQVTFFACKQMHDVFTMVFLAALLLSNLP